MVIYLLISVLTCFRTITLSFNFWKTLEEKMDIKKIKENQAFAENVLDGTNKCLLTA